MVDIINGASYNLLFLYTLHEQLGQTFSYHMISYSNKKNLKELLH